MNAKQDKNLTRTKSLIPKALLTGQNFTWRTAKQYQAGEGA
jgi:hypothetical protein